MDKYRTIRGAPNRGSVRSRGSSSSTASDPREKIKDCCRKLVAFMCTQVGVGGLVVGYAIVGAFGFISIEVAEESDQNKFVKDLIDYCADRLWELTASENVFNETNWKRESGKLLLEFQREITDAIKHGYNGRTNQDIWSFPAALMFCLSIFTMIGYGNMTPKTPLGKGLTVLYAAFGIPLYVLYFMNMGKALATTFRWLYTKLYLCSTEKRFVDRDGNITTQTPQRVIVPSTACLWVITGYVLTGTIMFAEWENWNYLDSVYFCMTSLCKIGIGDFVPGQNISESREGNQTKLVINFVYLLLGMGLIAMCYNLMREEVRVRARELKQFFNRFLSTKMRDGAENVALKLKGVVGYKGRQNDVIYCHPLEKSDRMTAVVYFGGDIQDFGENMQSSIERSSKKGLPIDEDNKNCLKWNLDYVASLLGSCFPTSHIIVVRPARMEFRMFSCFDNFVRSNNCGVPEHTPTHDALHHLEEMLKCISDRVRTKKPRPIDDSALEDGEIMGSPEQGEWWSQDLDLDMCNLSLIGFSKGCVVLNQFIYEFHYLKTLTPDDEILNRFVGRITDMYWLDGGHAGHKNTWITSRCLLETLSRLGIKIHVHVTPYQVRDERRAWIGNEQKMFTELLRAAEADIRESIHFENDTPTLQNHFQVLTAFCMH